MAAVRRTPRSASRVLGTGLLSATLLVLAACAGPSLKKEIIRDPPSFALPPATHGILWDVARDVTERNGAGQSGFKLLDASYDSLAMRLALIDSAVSSLDIQTYLWYPDNSGRLILERAVAAADRGVHTRLIIDDLLTMGTDQGLYELTHHPNIEVRLFNPWEKRGLLARAGEMIARMERLNQRMHVKLLIADGNATVVGGRNIGDHYFGLHHDYNFHDLDVLGFGPIASQANEMFDNFWNSEWVVSARNLDTERDAEFAHEKGGEIRKKNRSAPELQAFGADPSDWSEVLVSVAGQLRPGSSELIYDEATEEKVQQNVAARLGSLMSLARQELLITNAYIIPGQPGIDFLQDLTDRGVRIRILTNSLASHDVPAVNSHYKDWRDDLIQAGAELFELRPDAAIRSIVEVPPVKGEFIGLHTKAFVVDREYSFIGSMNLDPRSANINAEAGAFIHSPELAQDLARIMERDMRPENAWQVLLDEKGKLYWVDSEGRLDKQPARNVGQRVMDKIFKLFPKEQY